MSKKEAAKKLREEYLDEYGRVCLSPAKNFNSKEGRWENNNMLLYTGQAALLLKKNHLLENGDFPKFLDGFMSCQPEPGLFTRHPDPYRHQPEHHDIVSHDEYNGVMYLAAAFPEVRSSLCVDVCNYGDRTGFEYNDTPGFEFKSYFGELAKSPIKTIKDTIKMINLIRKKQEYRGEVGIAENLTQKRQLRDICFYRIMSDNDGPGLFEIIYMAIATILTLKKPLYHKKCSGRLLALYRMWAIEEIGFKSKILAFAFKRFRKGLEEQYGPDYVLKMHERHHTQHGDMEHPMLELCKGLK